MFQPLCSCSLQNVEALQADLCRASSLNTRMFFNGCLDTPHAVVTERLTSQGHHRCTTHLNVQLQGLAGAVCFWLDVLDPPHAAFPGYEL